MKYNAFSSKLITLRASKVTGPAGFEFLTSHQASYVARHLSKVFHPLLSDADRCVQVREIVLITQPEGSLIDNYSYLRTNVLGDSVERHFVSLTAKQVDLIVDFVMWYGQYNSLTVDAKHVFCVSDLNSGRSIAFQRSRY